MSEYRIGVVVGSLRRESFNRKFADALMRLGPAEFSFEHIAIDDLPLYNQDHDDNQPDAVKRLKAEISGCRGVVFVTPEYNRSLPGVLKNAIDNASRPYGQSAWAGKPAGIVGVSIGSIGTAVAQQHLRDVLAYLDMPTLGQPEVFIQMRKELYDASGEFSADTRKFMQGWMERYVEWVKRHAS